MEFQPLKFWWFAETQKRGKRPSRIEISKWYTKNSRNEWHISKRPTLDQILLMADSFQEPTVIVPQVVISSGKKRKNSNKKFAAAMNPCDSEPGPKPKSYPHEAASRGAFQDNLQKPLTLIPDAVPADSQSSDQPNSQSFSSSKVTQQRQSGWNQSSFFQEGYVGRAKGILTNSSLPNVHPVATSSHQIQGQKALGVSATVPSMQLQPAVPSYCPKRSSLHSLGCSFVAKLQPQEPLSRQDVLVTATGDGRKRQQPLIKSVVCNTPQPRETIQLGLRHFETCIQASIHAAPVKINYDNADAVMCKKPKLNLASHLRCDPKIDSHRSVDGSQELSCISQFPPPSSTQLGTSCSSPMPEFQWDGPPVPHRINSNGYDKESLTSGVKELVQDNMNGCTRAAINTTQSPFLDQQLHWGFNQSFEENLLSEPFADAGASYVSAAFAAVSSCPSGSLTEFQLQQQEVGGYFSNNQTQLPSAVSFYPTSSEEASFDELDIMKLLTDMADPALETDFLTAAKQRNQPPGQQTYMEASPELSFEGEAGLFSWSTDDDICDVEIRSCLSPLRQGEIFLAEEDADDISIFLDSFRE